jgi:hypothetical protein
MVEGETLVKDLLVLPVYGDVEDTKYMDLTF